jgi:hypothetical protein
MIVACLIVALGATSTLAAPRAAELLRSAWEEYGFENWSRSQALFTQALQASDTTPADRCQAHFGLASVVQYRMPGRDPEAAIPLYEKLLADLPERNPLRPAVLCRLGTCRIDQARPDYDRGRAHYREALSGGDMSAVTTQEAALWLIASYMRRPLPDEFRKGLAVATELLPRLRGATLEGVAHSLAASLAFNVGDLKRMSAEYEAAEAAGIENRQVREITLFRIARVNDVGLNDPAKAARYYRRLHDDIPSCMHAYYSGVRAAALESLSGTTNRTAAAVPSPGSSR